MDRRALARLVATGSCCAALASAACTPPASSAGTGDVAAANADASAPVPADPDYGELHPGRVTIGAPGVFSVPLESRLLPIVQCELDELASRHAFLDTGAEFSLITPTQADRMRCERHAMKPMSVSGMLASTQFDTFVRAPQLLIGLMTVRAPSLPVGALPLDLDCMCGDELLAQTALLFEPAAAKVSFGSADRIDALIGKRFAGAATSNVALALENRSWTLRLESGIGTLKLLLDTGAMRTMLNRAAVAARDLKPASTARTFRSDVAATSSGEVEYFAIDALRLGGWTVDLEAPAVPSPLLDELHADGVLGFDVLGQIPWAFEPEHARIVVVTPGGGEPPRLSLKSEATSDLKRMLADPYVPFQLAALGSIAEAREKRYLELAGPMLQSPHVGVRQYAALAIRQTLGAEWSSEAMEEAALRWWSENRGAPAK